jgi:phenylalanyl-tRNA synthetase beta chain
VPGDAGSDAKLEARFGGSYDWQPSSDPSLFPGRQAKVFAKGQEVGCFGIVHPEVLEAFDIPYPVSALELNLQPFCFDQFYQDLS